MKYILLTAALITIYKFWKNEVSAMVPKHVDSTKLAIGLVLLVTFLLLLGGNLYVSWNALEAMDAGRIGKKAASMALAFMAVPSSYLAYKTIILVIALNNKK